MATPSALERLVAGALERASFVPHDTKLIVASSGGPDSTALLRCLHHLRGEFGLSLHVAHLNHDFRGAEADHDAAFVQRLANGLGLPCSIDKQDPIAYQRDRGVSSFEQAAREMRYSFLSTVALAEGACAVALGHTADDQAETVLLHLLRGSGLHGLRGMAEVAEWPWPEPRPGPLLFRPLLSAGKADTAAFCRALGQTFRKDSGNYMWRFTRNKLRLDLLPRLARDYNPRVREALNRLSRAASDDLDYIEKGLDRHWADIAHEGEREVTINVHGLIVLHPALKRLALRRAYASVAGDSGRMSESHVEALMSLVENARGGKAVDLPRGIRARKEYDTLKLHHRDVPLLPRGLADGHTIRVPRVAGERSHISAGGWEVDLAAMEAGCAVAISTGTSDRFTALLDSGELGDRVTVRSRRPGDRFHPSGMRGTKKLQDFFVDSKVPRGERDSVPLLVCDRGIAWVVGYRVAEWALYAPQRPSLRVSLTPIDNS